MLLEPFSSVSAQTVLETYTYVVKGQFLEVEDPSTVAPPRLPQPLPPPRAVTPTPLLPQSARAPPFLATEEQPIAKNTQI